MEDVGKEGEVAVLLVIMVSDKPEFAIVLGVEVNLAVVSNFYRIRIILYSGFSIAFASLIWGYF